MLRAIAGTIIGVFAGVAAMVLIAYLGDLVYNVPIESGAAGPVEQAASALSEAPLGAKLFIALSWFAGGLAGAWVGRAISLSSTIGWTVAALLAVVTLLNIFVVPFPVWMQIATVAMPLLGGLVASHLPGPVRRPSEEVAEPGPDA